jgi:phage FluMu protein Com
MQTAYQKKQYDKCSKCPRLFLIQKKTAFGSEKMDKECPQCRELRLFNIKVTDPGFLGRHESHTPFKITPVIEAKLENEPEGGTISDENKPIQKFFDNLSTYNENPTGTPN